MRDHSFQSDEYFLRKAIIYDLAKSNVLNFIHSCIKLLISYFLTDEVLF